MNIYFIHQYSYSKYIYKYINGINLFITSYKYKFNARNSISIVFPVHFLSKTLGSSKQKLS